MAIGSGVLLPGVAENPTFPILRALAYTTGLGYRPTCDLLQYCVIALRHKKTRATGGFTPDNTEGAYKMHPQTHHHIT